MTLPKKTSKCQQTEIQNSGEKQRAHQELSQVVGSFLSCDEDERLPSFFRNSLNVLDEAVFLVSHTSADLNDLSNVGVGRKVMISNRNLSKIGVRQGGRATL